MFFILINVKILFMPVMAKLKFLQPLLQFSMSCDPSEIIIICCYFGGGCVGELQLKSMDQV